MSASSGPDIVENGLMMSLDSRNQKAFSGETFYNLLDAQELGNPSWANGATALTIFVIIRVLGWDANYAYHAVNKWGSSLENTSFVFYHFQNYQNTNPQNQNLFGWYAGAGGAWQGICSFYQATPNNTYFMALQYNSTSGGQLWINNVKIGGRVGSGVLGSGPNSIVIDGGVSGRSGIHKVEMVKFYNRELIDGEISKMYNVFKHRL